MHSMDSGGGTLGPRVRTGAALWAGKVSPLPEELCWPSMTDRDFGLARPWGVAPASAGRWC